MKFLFNQLGLALPKIQKHHIQLFIIFAALVMLVLGAGAPDVATPH